MELNLWSLNHNRYKITGRFTDRKRTPLNTRNFTQKLQLRSSYSTCKQVLIEVPVTPLRMTDTRETRFEAKHAEDTSKMKKTMNPSTQVSQRSLRINGQLWLRVNRPLVMIIWTVNPNANLKHWNINSGAIPPIGNWRYLYRTSGTSTKRTANWNHLIRITSTRMNSKNQA